MGQIKISDAEWVIMKALWSGGKMALKDIVKELGADNRWSYTTVRTLIVRLIDKGAIKADKTKGVYQYEAAIEKDNAVSGEVKSFVSRVFDGSTSQLIAGLVKDGEIDQEERAEIIKLLSELNEDHTE